MRELFTTLVLCNQVLPDDSLGRDVEASKVGSDFAETGLKASKQSRYWMLHVGIKAWLLQVTSIYTEVSMEISIRSMSTC